MDERRRENCTIRNGFYQSNWEKYPNKKVYEYKSKNAAKKIGLMKLVGICAQVYCYFSFKILNYLVDLQ